MKSRFIQSIATRLLSIVLSIYLVIAVSVTLLHLVAEYNDAREQVKNEIIGFHDTFAESVTLALWEFDGNLLESLLKGALAIPIISGIKVENVEGKPLMKVGEVDPLDLSRQISHKVDIIYRGSDVPKPIALGNITLYSSEQVVFDRVRLGFVLIIINAIIKTIALWVIFLWVSNSLLSRPLQRLTEATSSIDYSMLENKTQEIRTGGKNELALLESAFNSLIEKLHLSIKDKMQAEIILRESELRFRTLANVSPVGIIYTDENGHCTYTNKIWQELTEQNFAEALCTGWVGAVPDLDVRLFEKLKNINAPSELFKKEFHISTKSGKYLWVLGQCCPIRDDDKEVIGFVGTITDITSNKNAEGVLKEYNMLLQTQVEERTQKLQNMLDDRAKLLDYQSELYKDLVAKTDELKEANEKLNILATIDFLTDIYNRREFFRLADRELERAQRYHHCTALLVLDLDYFKKINDAHGHAVGDETLKRFCSLCSDALREQDFMGRLGGEEFAVLLPVSNAEAAIQVAERIRINIEAARISTPTEPLCFTVSIGVTESLEGEILLKELFDRADKALYQSKNNGRNRVTVILGE